MVAELVAGDVLVVVGEERERAEHGAEDAAEPDPDGGVDIGVGEEGKTFTFGPVSSLSSVYTINSSADASAAFFSQLGMKLSPKVTGLPNSSTPRRAQISPEQLSVLDADVVILSYPDAAIRAQFESQAVFKDLSAVKRGSYIALDLAAAVAVAFPSVLSIPYGLQVLVPELAAAASKA